MKRLLAGAAIVAVASGPLIVAQPPASAHGCGGTVIGFEGCRTLHSPWTQREPKPTVTWGVFTGTLRVDVWGDFGSASILECSVFAGSGECRMTRDEALQCCVEPWSVVCLAIGVGEWSCDHTAG